MSGKEVSPTLLLGWEVLFLLPFSYTTPFSTRPTKLLLVSDSRSNKINNSVILTLDVPAVFFSRNSEMPASLTGVFNWVNFVPWGHLTISGDILACYNLRGGRATGLQGVEAKDVTKRSAMHKRVPTARKCLA